MKRKDKEKKDKTSDIHFDIKKKKKEKKLDATD